MARTTINSLGIPADTIVSADLDYPLTDFSSTGIDDNASSTSLTIDSSGNISVTGTVDGRDLATDGSKLDGIAASATNYGDSDVATYISGNRSYGNITTTGYIAGPSTFTIDPAAVGDNTGTLVIAGNLQVDGTTTTINSTTMTVDDLNITLASGAANAAAANGAGITVDGASATLTYNSTSDAWSFNKNVGIGTTSPNAALDVNGGTSAGSYFYGGTNNRRQLIIKSFDTTSLDAGHDFDASSINGVLTFSTYSTEHMRIDSSGEVGIGTTDPVAKFSVNAKDGPDATFGIANFTTPAGNDAYITINRGAADLGGIKILRGSNADMSIYVTGAETAVIQYNGGDTGDVLLFREGSANTERMRIDNDGYVGIGTGSNTGARLTLDVPQYTASATDGMIKWHNTNNSGHSAIQAFWVSGLGSDLSMGSNFYWSTSGSTARWSTGLPTVGARFGRDGNFRVYTNTASGNATEKFIIDTSGNVGIGGITPAYSLHISEGATTDIVAQSTGANATRAVMAVDNTAMYLGTAYSSSNVPLYFGAGWTGSDLASKFMTLDASGNVGIGNTSPTNKLAIGTNLGTGYVITAASTSQYGMVLQTTESTPSNNATFWVRSEDSNGVNTVFRVNNNGRVGINASSMDGQLHVKGTTNKTVKIDPTFSSGTWTSLAFARNGTDLWRTFQNSSDQYLSFYNDQSSLYQLTLRNNGYVGINELAPFSPLHIEKITETATYTPTNFNSQPIITLVHSNTNGQYSGTRYTNTAGNYEWFTGSVQTGVNNADFVFQGYNRYASAYQEHVRITEKGRIGIGDDVPETPLHIKTTNKLGTTFTGSTRGEGITVEQTNYGSGNYVSLIEAPAAGGSPNLRIGAKFSGSGSYITMGTSNNYATGVTNQSFEMDPSGFTVLGNTSNGALTQLHVHALQSNYGPITARSNSYTTIWSILPWSSGITYMSSGIYYANNSWNHQSSTAHNCLLGITGSTGIRWYASSTSSGSWNLAQDVQLFNSSGQLTASSASDERLKENIVDYTIADALTKVNALRPVSFEWNDTIKRKKGTEYADGRHVGFIAQEVETVFPEACLVSDTDQYDAESAFDLDPDDIYYGDIKGVRGEKMVPILVGAIKELTRRLEILENA